MIDTITKEQFLAEHNRLSPENLQTTFAGLTDFQLAKKSLLKDSNWSLKLRIPLILWLSALPISKKKLIKKSKKQEFHNYPETKFEL